MVPDPAASSKTLTVNGIHGPGDIVEGLDDRAVLAGAGQKLRRLHALHPHDRGRHSVARIAFSGEDLCGGGGVGEPGEIQDGGPGVDADDDSVRFQGGILPVQGTRI